MIVVYKPDFIAIITLQHILLIFIEIFLAAKTFYVHYYLLMPCFKILHIKFIPVHISK